MQSIIKNKFIFIASMAFFTFILPQAIFAKEGAYNYELFLSYDNTEDETGLFTLNQYGLGLSFFELPVGYGDYPYLLTNFFERRTHMDFSILYVDSEFGSIDETSGNLYSAMYSFASVGSPVLFDLGVSRFLGEGSDIIGDYDLFATSYVFGFGYYISPNSVAKLDYNRTEYRLSDPVFGDFTYDENLLNASWQHVRKMSEENYISLLLDVEAIEASSYNSSNVGGVFDFYFNRKVGVGIGYTVHRGEYSVTEGSTLSLRASAFVNEQIGFVAQFSRLSADDAADSDEDNIYIKAIARLY